MGWEGGNRDTGLQGGLTCHALELGLGACDGIRAGSDVIRLAPWTELWSCHVESGLVEFPWQQANQLGHDLGDKERDLDCNEAGGSVCKSLVQRTVGG